MTCVIWNWLVPGSRVAGEQVAEPVRIVRRAVATAEDGAGAERRHLVLDHDVEVFNRDAEVEEVRRPDQAERRGFRRFGVEEARAAALHDRRARTSARVVARDASRGAVRLDVLVRAVFPADAGIDRGLRQEGRLVVEEQFVQRRGAVGRALGAADADRRDDLPVDAGFPHAVRPIGVVVERTGRTIDGQLFDERDAAEKRNVHLRRKPLARSLCRASGQPRTSPSRCRSANQRSGCRRSRSSRHSAPTATPSGPAGSSNRSPEMAPETTDWV